MGHGADPLQRVVRRRHDAYLDQIAAAARAYPYQVYVRPWPEMNGDWQTFQPTADGRRAHGGTYARVPAGLALRRDLPARPGRRQPALGVQPDGRHLRRDHARLPHLAGSAYVDVLGLDGFNWGKDAGWGRWRSFPQIFREQYAELTALHPRAPVWICEVSSKEPLTDDGAPVDTDRDKGAWVRDDVRPPGHAPTAGHRVVRRRQGTGLAGDLVPRLRPAVAPGDGRSCFVARA